MRHEELHEELIEKAVIVQTLAMGLYSGTLISKSGNKVILKNARRIFSMENAETLDRLVSEGVRDVVILEILLTECIDMIPKEEWPYPSLLDHIWEREKKWEERE